MKPSEAEVFRMDCRIFNTLADDIARGCLADEEIRRAAMNHAEACSFCAGRLAEAERLTHVLRQFAASMGDLQARLKWKRPFASASSSKGIWFSGIGEDSAWCWAQWQLPRCWRFSASFCC